MSSLRWAVMSLLSSPPALALSARELETVDRFVPYLQKDALEYASALRAEGFTPPSVSAILNQAKLRTQALSKFGEAAQKMVLTEAGFEQATRASVARLHAQRFKEAGVVSVADLGCGIGADSLEFSRAGMSVLAVELDETTAAMTAHNLSDYPRSMVKVGDVEHLDISELKDNEENPVQGLWLDPARRTVEQGRTSSRIFDAEAFSPPLSFVVKLAQTGIPMGVKMGPGIPHHEIPEQCEAQWISHGGQVVEVVLWFNALARKNVRRSATLLSPHPLEPEILFEITSAIDDVEVPPADSGEIEDFLYEPDGAIVRAHLVSELADQLGAHLIDEHIAYLSADKELDSPAVSGYRILGEMPLQEKVLKKWVREENIGTLTIKKRGVDIVPEQLRKKLLGQSKKKKGSVEGTLIVTRLGEGTASRRLALSAQPLMTFAG